MLIYFFSILRFIESWITSHYYDFAEDGFAIRSLLTFLDEVVMKSGFVADANRYKKILRTQVNNNN